MHVTWDGTSCNMGNACTWVHKRSWDMHVTWGMYAVIIILLHGSSTHGTIHHGGRYSSKIGHTWKKIGRETFWYQKKCNFSFQNPA